MPTDLSTGGGVLSASPSWPALQQEHAQLAQGWTQGRLAQLGTTLAAEGPRGALAKALDQELARLQRLARVAQQRTAVPPWPNRSSGTDEEDPGYSTLASSCFSTGPLCSRTCIESCLSSLRSRTWRRTLLGHPCDRYSTLTGNFIRAELNSVSVLDASNQNLFIVLPAILELAWL
ncbi:uncharacterized protein LOC119440233 [Dermacentor silvarum]|uniref:uncharacterized protein LOC119440233 n=1 Tax=Dermacentor silvarum TaxID=543639 RepID=UPI00189BDD32|nr:uncharacterized protein LOC119440233 [Dermacentor silvarum]